MTLESRSQKRAKIIEYIYKFELMDEVVSGQKAFEEEWFSIKEIKLIEEIEKKYFKFIKLIENFLSENWAFKRISPLERAILIFGAFELSFSNKKIVINEIISYTKCFIPGDNYKFINGVLDRIGEYYEKIKQN